MVKEYCQDCGAEIENVENWLLAATPKMWKCRHCFFNTQNDVRLSDTETVLVVTEEAA